VLETAWDDVADYVALGRKAGWFRTFLRVPQAEFPVKVPASFSRQIGFIPPALKLRRNQEPAVKAG